MRRTCESIPSCFVDFVEVLRRHLCDGAFRARHRARPEDFTRTRQLTFPVLMLFVFQKTVKSIQRHLHEFVEALAGGEVFESVTAGAVTHARAKLKHTAFIELNEVTVLPFVYGPERDQAVQRWRGHRLLGLDGSTLRLPNNFGLRKEFGCTQVSNDRGQTGTEYPEGRFVVLFDLLNRIGISAQLESNRVGEVELAIALLRQAKPGDVTVSDRGFAGYEFLAWHHRLGLDYLCRCSSASFAAAQELFRMNRAGRSMVVRLFARADQKARLRSLGLPLELKVRFVSVRLPGGELEVLATSLLDEMTYPTEEFLEVYHGRWKHETFHGMMKGRLDLENFSGETPEAIRQDFFATLFLCNLETILTAPAQESLRQESTTDVHPKQVNRAVAYHALKDHLLDLLYSDLPAEQVVTKLQRLFLAAPVSIRPGRTPPRRVRSPNRSYHFQRRRKKSVF